jgi:hypothetical protein
MTTVPTTLVLLDPSSDDGETALQLLGASDDHVALVTLISGRTSRSLRDYAISEDIDLMTAGWLYLDQVVARVDATNREVQTILADGPDIARELATIAAGMVVRRILLPSSLSRIDAGARDRLRAGAAAPIVMAEQSVTSSR